MPSTKAEGTFSRAVHLDCSEILELDLLVQVEGVRESLARSHVDVRAAAESEGPFLRGLIAPISLALELSTLSSHRSTHSAPPLIPSLSLRHRLLLELKQKGRVLDLYQIIHLLQPLRHEI